MFTAESASLCYFIIHLDSLQFAFDSISIVFRPNTFQFITFRVTALPTHNTKAPFIRTRRARQSERNCHWQWLTADSKNREKNLNKEASSCVYLKGTSKFEVRIARALAPRGTGWSFKLLLSVLRVVSTGAYFQNSILKDPLRTLRISIWDMQSDEDFG